MKKIFGFLLLFSIFSFTGIKAETTTTITEGSEKIENLEQLYNKNDAKICPSLGDINGIVVPIIFDFQKTNNLNELLDNAFNSNETSDGNYSVAEYYKESSYNKLRFNFTITETLKAENTKDFYEKKSSNRGSEYLIVEFFKSSPFMDSFELSNYDSNNDGKIDALYLIYDEKYDYESDFYWAYTKFFDMKNFKYPVEQFVFMSSYFFKDDLYTGEKKEFNSSTAIHETGHLLGLDDYYDYDESKGPSGGLGGEDMMDTNIGDHNPLSKILLQWIVPTVINSSGIKDLKEFSTTGNTYVITTEKEFNMFSEYIIIDYFDIMTPINNFNRPKEMRYNSNGVRVQRVDTRISDRGKQGSYYSLFHSDNSDTDNKFIEIVEKDYNNLISKEKIFRDADFFKVNDSLDEKNPFFRKSTKIEYGVKIDVLSYDKATNLYKIKFDFYNDNPNSPKISFDDKIEIKRNGKIKFDSLSIVNSDGTPITEYDFLGDFDANVPGLYEGSIKAKDENGNIAIFYFDINVTSTPDFNLMETTILICIGLVLVVGAIGYIKIAHDKKYKAV